MSFSNVLKECNLVNLNSLSNYSELYQTQLSEIKTMQFNADIPIAQSILSGMNDYDENGFSKTILEAAFDAVNRDLIEICFMSDVNTNELSNYFGEFNGWIKSVSLINSVNAAQYNTDYLSFLYAA